MNTSVVSQSVSDFLNSVTPTHRWMVYAYNRIQSAQNNSWRCQFCFVTTSVAQGAYNILVVGVPLSSAGNSTQLASLTQAGTVDQYNEANTMVDAIYSGNPCLGGVFSTYGGNYNGTWSSNAQSFSSGLKTVKGSSKYQGWAAFWAVQGDASVLCR